MSFNRGRNLRTVSIVVFFSQVTDGDFKVMEDLIKKIVKEKQPFERLEMKKSDLLEMFKYNEFKVRILNQKVKTETTTVYRCGPLIDLCRGPHVRHTGKIKGWLISEGILISVNLQLINQMTVHQLGCLNFPAI